MNVSLTRKNSKDPPLVSSSFTSVHGENGRLQPHFSATWTRNRHFHPGSKAAWVSIEFLHALGAVSESVHRSPLGVSISGRFRF